MKKIFVVIALCLALVQQLPAWTAPGKSSADVGITGVDSPDPATTGGQLTYSFEIVNQGPANASSTTLEDALPTEVTLVSATPSQGGCSGTATVTCSLGTLPTNSAATVEIVVQPKQAGSITNSASVRASQKDPNSSDNSASLTTEVREPSQPATSADVRINGVGGSASSFFVGYLVRLSATAQNLGPSPATLVRITVSGGSSLLAVSDKGFCTGATCTIPVLQPGETVSVIATGAILSDCCPGLTYAHARVTAAEPDPNPDNNEGWGYVWYGQDPRIPSVCGRACPM